MLRAVMLALLMAAPVAAQTRDVAPVIREIEDDLGAIRGIIAAMEDAPATSIPFVTDRVDLQRSLNRHLDGLLRFILGDDYAESRARLLALDATLAAAAERAAEARVERLSAPKGDGELTLLDRAMGRTAAPGSQGALDAEIAALEAGIREREAERDALIDAFRDRLAGDWGLSLDRDEAEAVLYQVNGATIVEAAIVFDVIARIEARLREIQAVAGDERVMRRYYAVAAVTRLLIVRLHERHLRDYAEVWLPRLAAIEGRNDRLMTETADAAQQAQDPARRAAYEANLAVQRRVDAVIDAYRTLLAEREDMTRRGLAIAEQDAAVALNTLRTLETATSLSSEMLWSASEFEALMSLSAPELLPLDPETFDAFRDVSRELAAGS
jgi:hypothetical protein